MDMEMTAQVNIQNATLKEGGAYQKHNEHDEDINHKNLNIDFDMKQYNKHWENEKSEHEILEDVFGAEIKAKNEKLTKQFVEGKISQKRYEERQINNVEEYLEKKNPLASLVVGLGSAEKTEEFLQALDISYHKVNELDENHNNYPRLIIDDEDDRERWSSLMDDCTNKVLERLNESNSLIPVSADFHADEMPQHLHIVCVKNGPKSNKSGKVSTNLNNCIKDFLGDKATSSNQQNMALLNKELANLMVDELNDQIKDRVGDVNLSRTGKASGLTMDARKELKARESNLKQQEEFVERLKTELDNKKTDIEELEEMSRRREQELNEREKAYKARMNKLRTREQEINTREQSLNDRLTYLDIRETEINVKESQLKELYQQLVNAAKGKFKELIESVYNGVYDTIFNDGQNNRYRSEPFSKRQSKIINDTLTTSYNQFGKDVFNSSSSQSKPTKNDDLQLL